MNVLEKIAQTGILPVIKIEDVSKAVPLADALRKGGINAIEVTARSEAAFDAISAIKSAFPDMAVGAGTILSTELVDRAINAGAEYCVAPGFNPKTGSYCIGKGLPIVPGCSSTSDLELANEAGLETVKFFPAEANGGVEALKLLNGPFPKLKFVPTGGVNFDNIGSYLKLKCVAACGGSYMAKADLIRDGKWDVITANCRKALDISLGFTLAHVGFNHGSSEEAAKTAELLCRMFRLNPDPRSKCTFAGPYFENMNFKFYGEKGHIGIRSNSIRRAVAYLESQGFEFNQDSCQYKNGELTCIYLKDEIAGFAFHII